MIDALARIPDLRVTARTSSFAFRNTQQDVREIGSRLGAEHLLEGSVRRAGDRVRVSAQLVSAADGYHVWSESYDRQLSDVFAIQSEVAHSIALALKVRLAPESLAGRHTPNLEAYELWVKGRLASMPLATETLGQANEFFMEAMKLDPRFARPYPDAAENLFHICEFGMNTSPDTPREARALAVKALELDDSLSDAHALVGMLRALIDYDWPGAELSFQRALQISPGSASVLARHAWYCLLPQRKVEQALIEAEEAVTQDPLSPLSHNILGLAAMSAHDAVRAERECRTAAELAPELWLPQWCLGAAMILGRKVIRGLRLCGKVYAHFPRQPSVVAGMCNLYALFFRKRKAKQLLGQLVNLANNSYVPPVALAMAYLGLGDDRAFEWFDKAVAVRDRYHAVGIVAIFRPRQERPQISDVARQDESHLGPGGSGAAARLEEVELARQGRLPRDRSQAGRRVAMSEIQTEEKVLKARFTTEDVSYRSACVRSLLLGDRPPDSRPAIWALLSPDRFSVQNWLALHPPDTGRLSHRRYD